MGADVSVSAPPLPVSSVNTDIPHAWERYLAKAPSRIQRPAMTRVMWRAQNYVFYAAPQIMRTPLFRLEIREVGFFCGGGGLASWAAAKWGLSSGWVLYGVFDDFLSSEFFLLFGKPPETRDDSSWRFNSSSAQYSRALRPVCTKLLSGQIQETRLWSSWQHVPAVNLVW